MTIHLGIWWLIIPAIIIYAAGVIIGLAATLIGDAVQWWLRPAMLAWPLIVLAWLAARLCLFMTGRD